MQADIEQTLRPFIGEQLWGAARAANMLSLQVGPPRLAPTSRDPDRKVGAYALHVFCPWRLTRGADIIVASGDLYTPADPDESLDDFDWDRVGSTWWDVGMREVFGEDARVQLVIEAVRADALGGMALMCSADFTFEVFPNSSLAAHVETEFWRVFAPGTDGPHTVCSSSGLHRDG